MMYFSESSRLLELFSYLLLLMWSVCPLEVLKSHDYKMHLDAGVEHSALMQRHVGATWLD